MQDMVAKMDLLQDLQITWHFIGHLQTNKVKGIIDRIQFLHTLDRISLAEAIEKHATHTIQAMVQVNMTGEIQKSGINPENLAHFLDEMKKYDKIEIIGLMTIGMASDRDSTEKAFKDLQALAHRFHLTELSMGMSDDYDLALRHGATYLRIGRKFKELL